MGCINPFRPAGLYECMLQRVMPYTLRGFLYYQGESDDHKPKMYERLLRELIAKWREDWEDVTLPFLMVQLPMHRYAADPDYKHWCLIREAQMRVFETVKNTGIAVTLDLGEFNEIHPKEKETVGERLALQAMWLVYGLYTKKRAFGPVFKDAVQCGGELLVRFDCAEDGFEIRTNNIPGRTVSTVVGDEKSTSTENSSLLTSSAGFEIAGADRKFVPAEAVRDAGQKNVLWLSAEGVDKPVYARYCWTNFGEVNYFGKNGLPMAPFRTNKVDERERTETSKDQKAEIRQVMEL